MNKVEELMTTDADEVQVAQPPVPPFRVSADAEVELEALGITGNGDARSAPGLAPVPDRETVSRRAISAPEILNEAHDYEPRASSFSRGLRVELPGYSMLLLSGTASIDERGETLYPGDFEAQCLRTYRNLTRLLIHENASWHDVVRTSCYLRDIERDYDTFNDIRTYFFETVLGLDPLPASTGIQARLCRSDLLVEIEATAILKSEATG